MNSSGQSPSTQVEANRGEGITFTHVYFLPMKTTLCIALKGQSTVVKLAGVVRITRDDYTDTLTAYDAKDEKLGQFALSEISGEWYE